MKWQYMVWPFSKKQHTRVAQKLIFKSSVAFFESQCQFGQTEIKPGQQGIVALVLDAAKEFGTPVAVKVEPDGRQLATLKVASQDGGFIVTAYTATGKGDRLKPNDVVVWVPFKYIEVDVEKRPGFDERFGWVGLIMAKIVPEVDVSNPNLTVVCRYD